MTAGGVSAQCSPVEHHVRGWGAAVSISQVRAIRKAVVDGGPVACDDDGDQDWVDSLFARVHARCQLR